MRREKVEASRAFIVAIKFLVSCTMRFKLLAYSSNNRWKMAVLSPFQVVKGGVGGVLTMNLHLEEKISVDAHACLSH